MPFRVESALDARELRIAIQTGEPGDGDGVLEQAQAQQVATGFTNRLSVPRRTNVPWRVNLAHLGNLSPLLPVPDPSIEDAEIRVGIDARLLPSAHLKDRDLYFFTAADPSDEDLSLVASLIGQANDFRLAGVPHERGAVDDAMGTPLQLGSVSFTLPNVKVRRFLTPPDLRSTALVCGEGELDAARRAAKEAFGVHRGSARQPYKRCELQKCALFIPAGPSASSWLRTPQRVKITVTKGKDPSQAPIPIDVLRDGGLGQEKLDDGSVLLEIPTLREKLGDVDDYAELTFHALHAPESEFGADLSQTFVHPNHQVRRDSTLDVRMIVVPSWSMVSRQHDGGNAVGARFYVTGTGALSLVRSRSRGFVATSDEYERDVNADFDYGVLAVLEGWNFSENTPLLPVFSPQVVGGVLGPTKFDDQHWWKDFSGVLGFNFRLPASRSPSAESTEGQAGLLVWYEISSGARDYWLHSILFGLNLSVGALSP